MLCPLLFLLCINDMPKCSNILEFQLFADDTNLFFNNPNILYLETILNVELEKVSQFLYAKKLSLNIEKNSFVVFHSPQRRIAHKLNLSYDIPFTGKHEPNKLTCSPLCDFIAQLVRALHRRRRGHGFESR